MECWIIEKMVIGKDMKEMEDSAKKIAEENAEFKFKSKFTQEKNLDSSARTNETEYKMWKEEHIKEFDNLKDAIYKESLNEMKRMWYFKHCMNKNQKLDEVIDKINKLFPHKKEEL